MIAPSVQGQLPQGYYVMPPSSPQHKSEWEWTATKAAIALAVIGYVGYTIYSSGASNALRNLGQSLSNDSYTYDAVNRATSGQLEASIQAPYSIFTPFSQVADKLLTPIGRLISVADNAASVAYLWGLGHVTSAVVHLLTVGLSFYTRTGSFKITEVASRAALLKNSPVRTY